MTCPLVSVIIPTYNYAIYILEAIKSVLEQDYPIEQIEIIVVDDGSTDGTKEVLETLIEESRIRYFSQMNKGKASATYTAVQHTSGKYIFNLDADDYFYKTKIKEVVNIFESDHDIVHVGNSARFIIDHKEAGREHFPETIADKKVRGIELLEYFYSKMILYGGGSTFAARGDILRNIFIPASVDMYIDEFLILAVLNKGDSYLTSKLLSVWREHSNNYTVKQLKDKAKYERLDRSSMGISVAIEQADYPVNIRRLYSLKNESRHMFFKELANEKRVADIIRFIKFIFIDNKFSIKELKTYSAFNRFMPQFLINILKGKK